MTGHDDLLVLLRASTGQHKRTAFIAGEYRLAVGNHLPTALLLSHYAWFCANDKTGKLQYHASYDNIMDYTGLTEWQVKSGNNRLLEFGIITIERRKRGTAPTNLVTLNVDRLVACIRANEANEPIRRFPPDGQVRFGGNRRMDSAETAGTMDSAETAGTIYNDISNVVNTYKGQAEKKPEIFLGLAGNVASAFAELREAWDMRYKTPGPDLVALNASQQDVSLSDLALLIDYLKKRGPATTANKFVRVSSWPELLSNFPRLWDEMKHRQPLTTTPHDKTHIDTHRLTGTLQRWAAADNANGTNPNGTNPNGTSPNDTTPGG